MIAKLIFKLPEEREEFEQTQRAGNDERVIHELFNMICTKMKYENKKSINLEELREFLIQECENEGVP